MLEELYRKRYQEIKPSDELADETLGLMKEARDHGAALPQKPARWRLALAISAAATATAAAVAVIFVGVWMHHNSPVIEDTVGSLDSIVIGSGATGSDTQGSAEPEDESQGQPTTEGDDADSESTEDQAGSQEDTVDTPSEEKTDPPKGEPGDEQNSTEDEQGGENSSESILGGYTESVTDDLASVPNSDPLGPDYVYNDTTRTYYSIYEFLSKLTTKETTGYGKNYYNAKDLVIVPSLLPDGARFRHLHLFTDTGKYSYSYVFSKDNKDYILDIEVDAKTPKTLRDLKLQQEKLATETVQTGVKDNQMAYLFGENDYVLITVTEVMSSTKLTQEQTVALLTQFRLERCSQTNTIINMTYQ